MTTEELIRLAEEAMTRAYAPYSHFRVGAALLTDDGTVYTGCNIENAAYSPTICAERAAFAAAVSAGHRKFTKIAVVGGMEGKLSSYTFPCGVCRQVMREFCKDDFTVYLIGAGETKTRTLSQLLPDSFSL
jgi:cytidine deaminase